MRIGILGGTFDPPHRGHLEFARAAIEALKLDEVIFLPAHRNPLKRGARQTPARQRLEMVRLMLESEPQMSVSDLEITRGGPSYTVDSLDELQVARPGDYWLLIGADALRRFDEWKRPDRILKQCRLGVAIRPPATEMDITSRLSPAVRERIDFVPMTPVDISATELRARIAGKSGLVVPFLAAPVLRYIEHNQLYR